MGVADRIAVAQVAGSGRRSRGGDRLGRGRLVVVVSRGAFSALPMDPQSLRAAATFQRLYRMLPQVDLTNVYSMSGVVAKH